jgi:hypothetical protein
MAALALLPAACGPEGHPAKREGHAAPPVALDPVAVIGRAEGDSDYLFGDIRSVAVDEAGNVYVGDRIGATVRAYSPRGQFLERIAREGRGPGEITGWPADLAFGPGGALYVRDDRGVTAFARSGRTGLADSLARSWRAPGYGDLTYDRSHVADDGTYYYPGGSTPPGKPPRFFYLAMRGGHPTGDTLEVPPLVGMRTRNVAYYRVGAHSGRMLKGLSHVPFAATPSWDVTDRGTVLSSDGTSDTLLETGPRGDTLRILALGGGKPRPIPPDERGDSLEALNARIDSLPVPLKDVMNLGADVADRRLPDVLPSVLSVRVATSGLIWVERWPAEGAGESRSYDVFDSAGARLASVRLRAPLASDPPPFFSRRAVVGVTRDPETGVGRVVTFSLDSVPALRARPAMRRRSSAAQRQRR